jgi:FkbM family methyltransferase
MRHLDMPTRLRHMASLGFRPETIVDVGAADGAWSRLAAAVWPDAQVFAFEPNRRNERKLEEAQRELPHFAYQLSLVGATPGRVAYADRGTQTSLYSEAKGTEDAEMVTLDACFEGGLFPQPQLLKLDVQGYELQVLEGGQRVLSGCEAVLAEVSFFHFHPDMPVADDVIAYLKDRGFVVYDTMGLLRLPKDDALAQMDLMFLRADHRLRGPRTWWIP